MSRRTAESNKAILVAWNKERELVQEGKGTREWTPQQQQDILDKGKAYDEDGIAFQGQHMKSAEMYPEYQGEPGNIQFLTRAEHLEAHKGNWRNPTNWYFNPVTKEKFDFGDGPFIPCKIIPLPEPIVTPILTVKNKEEKIPESVKDGDIKKEPPNKPDEKYIKEKGFGSAVRKAFIATVDFSNRHPILTNIAKAIGMAGLAAVAAKVVPEPLKQGSLGLDYSKSDDDDYNYDGYNNDDSADEDSLDDSESSYTPNDVPAGRQRYHYKDGSVKWKDKSAYHRGGNKD